MSGTITVPNYPANNLVPGVYFNVSPSGANTATQPQRGLIIGQKRFAGAYQQNQPILMVAKNDVYAGGNGPNAMISRMFDRYRMSDPTGEVWGLPLSDDAAATATVVTLTVTGTATAAGSLSFMIGGQPVNVGVNVGDLNTAIAANINATANAVAALPATATVATNVVTLTADNQGQAAGDLDVRLNYYGSAGNQSTPAGVMVAIATTAGTGNPSTGLATALSNLGNKTFDFIVCPYTDTASLNLIDSLAQR